MGRKPCCSKEGLNRGPWSAQEDKILINYIQIHGQGKWRDLPHKAGLKRCGKSCRLRWLNYLRPDIKRGDISAEEEELIIRLHKLLGNRWALIAGRLPGRTDNEIKNYWNTNLRKKLKGDDKSTSMQLQINGCSIKSSKKSSSEEINKPAEPHRVFRTKAVRCTKVVIPGLLDFNQTVDNVGAENVVSQSSSALIQEDNNSATSDHDGLLMDFDISELLLWDALNSSSGSLQANDYHQINENGDHCDPNVANGDHLYHHGLECSDFAHEAMFEDLLMDERTTRLGDHPFQNNDMMDLKSL
ncbi:hypothetical protein LWI29_001003 [Acer saccharum]|uniref:Uncharacterized protein n=1 Tax=Acer saccharum TaxID=4024 RepID=A0AA39V5Y1_ACESA|nr:hypothetical protein LWI29_001003 [Acer saccharum]KAK1549562.1 hypothetical protein Q3G72_003923 [Acer saccharum]KAK1551355.1 hypothetical protein Q3G72_034353 [Acer saccharum]